MRVDQGPCSLGKKDPGTAGNLLSSKGNCDSVDDYAAPAMQERLSHLIAQATTDAFVAIDPQNRIIYWNRGAEQLLGWSADEVTGKNLDLVIPQDKREGHHAGLRRLSKGGTARLIGKTTEVPARHRCGKDVPVELSLTLWRDPETGLPAGYGSIMRDISERRRLEEERDAYERQLEEQLAAVQATTDGVAITDQEGRFIFMNPAHAQMFGIDDPAEMIGLHWSTIYSPEEAERIGSVAVPEVIATGHWRGEAQGIHREGRIIEQEVSLSGSPNGGLVCTTRDIGERQRAMRERIRTRERLLLAERQEMIGRAVSGLVHDLANLMAVITASAATLARKQRPHHELARIENAAGQATTMLEKILAPETRELLTESIDANSALESVADLTAVSLRPLHSIRVSLPDEKLALRADRTEFMRVLMNLCINARDSLPKEKTGSIQLRLEIFDHRKELPAPLVGTTPGCPSALITVSDTGCGIAAEDLQQVFEPFETRKSFGTGLGLAVVSSAMVKAGGSISVVSGPAGTDFHLVWPLAGNEVHSPEYEEAESRPNLAGKRILVAEDNPAVLEVIASELRRHGAEIGPCENPLEALAVLADEASNWDALVVDYDMPEMNGAELATAVRERWPKMPIVLCTAWQGIDDVGQGERLFDARVTKSALARDLPTELRRLLVNSHGRSS